MSVTEGVDLHDLTEEEACQAMADAVAAEHDLNLTAEDILIADAEAELSDVELEAGAGGPQCDCFTIAP